MKYEKLSPALAALMFEYGKFPEAISEHQSRPQAVSISSNNLLETSLFIHCDENAEFENLADMQVVAGKKELRTARVELEKINDLSERNDVYLLACWLGFEPSNSLEAIEQSLENHHSDLTGADAIYEIISSGIDVLLASDGNNSEGKTKKTTVIAPGKFAPAKFNFVVPSNSLPDSPPEVLLRGWFKSGDCEIMIMSPNGGVTKSAQAEMLAGNPTRYGNYSSSQAFLTKPTVLPNGRREFFIDLRPIAPKEFVTGGTWRLTVTNVGVAEMTVTILTSVPENAAKVEFL